MREYELSDLLLLSDNWEIFFNDERKKGRRAQELIYNNEIYKTPEAKEKAEKMQMNLRVDNILLPMSQKLISSLRSRKLNLEIKEKYSFIEEILENSRFELDQGIKDLVNEGYCSLLYDHSKKLIYRMSSDYPTFFDRFAVSDSMVNGNYCGYKCVMSPRQFEFEYGLYELNKYSGYFYHSNEPSKNIDSLDVYKIWIRTGTKDKPTVTQYTYTLYSIVRAGSQELENVMMPLVFGGNIAIRNIEKISLVRFAEISEDLQKSHNYYFATIEKIFGEYFTSYLAAADSVPPQYLDDYKDGTNVIRRYERNSSGDLAKTGEPSIVRPNPLPAGLVDLFNLAPQKLNERWINEIDIVSNSKYDSLGVLTEKQRAAQNAGISSLLETWERTLHAITAVIISFHEKQGDCLRKGMQVIKIGGDEQREENLTTEMIQTMMQYVVPANPALAPLLAREMLLIKGDNATTGLIAKLDEYEEILNREKQESVENRPEIIKAQTEIQKAQITAQTQLEVAKLQIYKEQMKLNHATKETMRQEEKAAPDDRYADSIFTR